MAAPVLFAAAPGEVIATTTPTTHQIYGPTSSPTGQIMQLHDPDLVHKTLHGSRNLAAEQVAGVLVAMAVETPAVNTAIAPHTVRFLDLL